MDSQLHQALFAALHSCEGASDRWQNRREAGLSDDELRAAIAAEFGISGGSGGPDASAAWQGSADPRFWFAVGLDHVARTTHPAAPTLRGKKLLNAVRGLLGIPQPGQIRLF